MYISRFLSIRNMANGNTNNEATAHFSKVKFGSNNMAFTLVIDTGSSDTWTPSDTCWSCACLAPKRYGTKASTTLVKTMRTFSIQYGSGQVEGTIVSDSVWFAGFNTNISFGMATRVSDEFIYFPVDGITGLGFQNASTQKVQTIMDDIFVFEDSSTKIVFLTLICNVIPGDVAQDRDPAHP